MSERDVSHAALNWPAGHAELKASFKNADLLGALVIAAGLPIMFMAFLLQ